MQSTIPSAWIQVLSLGVLWTSLHCVGMCGPIMFGLSQHAPPTWTGRLGFVLRYQSGKAIVYVTAGVLLGMLGGESGALSQPFGWVVITLGVILALHAVGFARVPDLAFARPVLKLGFTQRVLKRPLVLGLLMSLLPCSLVFWALGLSASTGNAFDGGITMMLFVLTTTPMLLLAALAGKRFSQVSNSDVIIRVIQFVSAVWIIVIGLAAIEWIPHFNVAFQLFGKPFGVMFF